MRTGYPRFFIHLTIQELEREVLSRYGRPGEAVMLFPSPATAKRCQDFFHAKLEGLEKEHVRIIGLFPSLHNDADARENRTAVSCLFCVFFPKQHFSVAKQVWQHSGDGISSRRGEFCLKALQDGLLIPEGEATSPKHHQDQFCKGPRRYQRGGSQNSISGISHATKPSTDATSSVEVNGAREGNEFSQFVEERFGRNLNAELATKAKIAVRRRIAGCLTDDSDLDQALSAPTDGQSRRIKGLTEDDVYLYPTGMSSIFNTHRILMASRHDSSEPRKSICFGFPYIDTLKILQKWGPGCLFYGNGLDSDLDDLERRLESGERYLALFTEFPSNPLLNSPDLPRIRQLADKYDFAVVVDESVGNFINVNVLSHADVVVSSLTKAFSGDSNVMGGSAVLNPHGRLYETLKQTLHAAPGSAGPGGSGGYEDNYWAEDAVFLERNSRDFISRIKRINASASAIAAQLHSSPRSLVKQVYYPQYSASRPHYDRCRNSPGGGYGGLLSVTFQTTTQAVAFFDALEVHKGPSLGTNFTLSCPYTILAHYGELEWAGRFGVEADLIRISFGLEDRQDLEGRVERALSAAARAG
jgi:cystathionine gamma-synthase